MTWDLPVSVEIDGKRYAIRNQCDYRMILDVIAALNDEDLEIENRIQCALIIFYEDMTGMENVEAAIKEMFKIINYGEEERADQARPKLMDWEQDFRHIAPPVSRILGYDIRTPDKYTHWWSFLGGYMEIGECSFATVVSIRQKLRKGKKLEKWEQEFLSENRDTVILPTKYTKEEKDLLALFE